MAKDNKVFVDSNFFIALFNPNDALHSKAVTLSRKIKKANPQVFISNFIFLEIVTALSQRVSRKAAITLGKHLIEDKQLEIIHVDQRSNTQSWEIFQKIRKKNISFADCSSLAVMKFEGIKKFLTFDHQDFSSLRQKYQFVFYK